MNEITPVHYQAWANCYRLSNDQIEIIITADVGPRIVHLGFVGGHNELFLVADDVGRSNDDDFRFYGGHRLWHAPEVKPRTYHPDNKPVTIQQSDGRLQATAPVEKSSGIQKQITVEMSADEPHLRLTHRLTNHGAWSVELAAWAITMCAPGGVGIMPLPPQGETTTDLLPRTAIALWPYTRPADARWLWGNHFVMLRHDQQNASPQKAGLFAPDGWVAYANRGHLLVKVVRVDEDAVYPDRGCNVELYADGNLLEIETLGLLTQLAPGQHVEHIEDWYLFDGVSATDSEADVQQHILPLIESVLRSE